MVYFISTHECGWNVGLIFFVCSVLFWTCVNPQTFSIIFYLSYSVTHPCPSYMITIYNESSLNQILDFQKFISTLMLTSLCYAYDCIIEETMIVVICWIWNY
jgi:hypothetical protein